jgi:hypothetical protein
MSQASSMNVSGLGDDTLQQVKSGVSGARMMATLSHLARWTKLAGTAEELESLKGLSREFEDIGFRVEILHHDAYISLPGPASLVIGNRNYTCITHSMAKATEASGLVGELIDVGAGTEQDLAALDLAGKIAVIDGIANPAAVLRLSRCKVAGIIHVSPHEQRHEMCVSPIWGSPSIKTMGDLPDCAVVTVNDEDGAGIRAELAANRGLKAQIKAEVDTGWRKTPLLVAEMDVPDASEAQPYVLFSAHHDTWYYGVMDNGSANAVVVEAARLAAQHREKWRRGLKICIWSGHSQGRYSGSAWYVDQNWHDLNARCLAHLNIDSPGGIGANNLANTGVMSALHPLAAQAIAAETGQKLAGKPKVRSADESLQSVGVPSMFGSLSGQILSPDSKMRNALGWWWHTPEDLIDKIDETNLVRDARIVTECLWRLLADSVVPIDVLAPLGELTQEVRQLAGKLGSLLDLEPLTRRIEHLDEIFRGIRTAFAPEDANFAIKLATRELVMLQHSHGDRFIHEAAINQPIWPVLEPLRRLAATEPGSDRAKFAHVDAVRALTRIEWHLDQIKAGVAALKPQA